MIQLRAYTEGDIAAMADIWNAVVEEGIAFPQEEMLDWEAARAFFGEQSHCGVALEGDTPRGMYILHPNNLGRCGHIANASYAVQPGQRDKHIGEKLVRDSMAVAASLGFRILQFNAVVTSNAGAIHLYEKIGFIRLGTIPGGFRMADGTYADIHPFYISLA